MPGPTRSPSRSTPWPDRRAARASIHCRSHCGGNHGRIGKRRTHIVRRDTARPTTAVEEIQIAVDRDKVSFSMVMKALYLQRPEFSSGQDEAVTARCRELYPKALAQFMTAHDGIQDSFYAERFPAGVALTGSDELFVSISWDVFVFDTTAARELEAEINELRLKLQKFVSRSDRRLFVQRVTRFYEMLISSLDVEQLRWAGVAPGSADRTPSPQHLADARELRVELARIRLAYLRVGTTRGLASYIGGAVAGVAAIVSACLTFWVLTGHDGGTIWPGVVAGGSFGALFSVLERQTRGALDVHFESDAVILGGVTRPVVGTISGLAMYALVEGGIIPLEPPAGETQRWLFFAAVAFLSGFSERFAKDAFGSAAGSLSAGSSDEGSSNATSSTATSSAGAAPVVAREFTTGASEPTPWPGS